MKKFQLRVVSDAASCGEQPSNDCSDAAPCVPRGNGESSESTRTFRERAELDRIAGAADPKTVNLSVRSLVPLLIDAAENDRTWLQDFADDAVRIDADLYDVLLAYQQVSQDRAA